MPIVSAISERPDAAVCTMYNLQLGYGSPANGASGVCILAHTRCNPLNDERVALRTAPYKTMYANGDQKMRVEDSSSEWISSISPYRPCG